jgi:NADPH:quinone reductase-like Zn-dependent oxidoreductase
MDFVNYRPDTPEGRDAQLQAIAIITAGLDSTELLQQEMTAAIGPHPDPASWVLLTIALGKIGVQMTAFAAAMDAENAAVLSGEREQVTAPELLQNWAQLIVRDEDLPD